MPSADPTRPELAPPQTRRQRRNRFRGDIEGMRAVAVLLVVAFHAGVKAVSGGFVGVDVFFVLSGFLITGLLVDEIRRTGTISLADFYARRVRRLLPLSTLVLAATAGASFLLVPPIDRKGIAADLAGAGLWGANWRFAAESTQYMADTDKSPVLHYWSLSVEEQFYVVWPLLLLLLVGSSGLARRAWGVAFRRMSLALALLVVGSLVVSWKLTASGSPFAYFGLHTRAWELGIGAALALARPALGRMTRRAAHAAALTGLLMVVGSALLMDESTPFPGTAALVPVLGAALLVGAGTRVPDEGVGRALGNPVLRYIGRVSYAWYLWHWPVLVLANTRFGEVPAGSDTGEATAAHAAWPVVLAAVALSFALAVASHYLVEQPMRHAGFFKARRGRSLRLGGALVGVSLVSSCALLVGGSSSAEQDAVSVPQAAGAPAAPPAPAPSPAAGEDPAEEDPAGPTTPAAARDDRPRDGDDCYVAYESTTVPPAQKCRFGPAKGAKRTIALVGDSHAMQWRPALERAAKERGWAIYVFAKSSCTVSDAPVWLKQNKAPYDSCGPWRDKVLDRVAGIKGLDAVVIGRWMDYRTLALQPDGSQSTPENIGSLWTEASKRSFARMAKATKRIVVMKDVPRPATDVPSCLSQHPDDVEECGFDRDQGTGLDAALVKAEKAAAPKAVRFVDVTDVMCPAKRCQVVTAQGQIMFRDTHHLTAGYSESLWKVVSDRLEKAIRS
jgi:peptidoglycan/LPS O-acetylase OafA/YrhL